MFSRNFLVIAMMCGVVSGSQAPLTMLTDPKAKCLDGTQAGYYFELAANSADKNKWVIYLEGGGECDAETPCGWALSGSLGSSKYFPATSDSSGWFLGSAYCPYNPEFCGWNHARDPYCTQDLHAGQVTTPTEKNWGLYFAGHHVFTATLDALDKAPNSLLDATDIILQGVSAGGIGVWMNVDYLAQRYPKARVTAATVAGHYFYATYYNGTNHTSPGGMGDFRESALPNTYTLYEAFVDADCQAAYEGRGESPGACLLSNNSMPYIQSDVFLVQAQTDQTVLTGHDTWPETYMKEQEEMEFMNDWHNNMTVALQPLLSPSVDSKRRSGVFAAACYTHTSFNHAGPLLSGINYQQAFTRFYFNTTEPAGYRLSDDCGLMCNPTCN